MEGDTWMGRRLLASGLVLAALALAGCGREEDKPLQPEATPVVSGIEAQAPGPGTPSGARATPDTTLTKPVTPAPKPISYHIESAADPAGPWAPLPQNRWLPSDSQ